MDRERLQSWLEGKRRTWRWNRGDASRYVAVEATNHALRWYRWSHEMEEGGPSDELHQTHAAFRSVGAPTAYDVPPGVLRELTEWLDALDG
ncbi:MAG: hypothetical protein H6721_26335 [Sandaracinus sp.]|nr:hypothetical protein [Sandaracinus sp.]MCB9619101.1 hypothetical protein [Sandaracinus sp.]MCB9622708.1 hypothetical protein [Sandaracinus sp.]MCB9635653.1 hypothetical protein [Sandaracinus sp.]